MIFERKKSIFKKNAIFFNFKEFLKKKTGFFIRIFEFFH